MSNNNEVSGSLVRLKSGGPTMTVAEVSADNVSVSWFDKAEKLQTSEFYPDQLELVADDKADLSVLTSDELQTFRDLLAKVKASS